MAKTCTSIARGGGSIPGWGTHIPHAMWNSQKEKVQGAVGITG